MERFQSGAGYRVGNLDDLDVRFKCTHCCLLLREPMQGDCGHRYCRDCVQHKHNEALAAGQQPLCSACEPDDAATITKDRTYPDNAIRREINKTLQVRCPNSPCEETMLLKELLEHVGDCEHRPVSCPSCQQQVPASQLRRHQADDCPKREAECDKCGDLVPIDEMQRHQAETCVGSTRQCQYCLQRVRDSDAEMDEHLRNSCSVGWHDDRPCPYGCAEMPRGWRQHRDSCLATHIDLLLAQVRQPGSSLAAQLTAAKLQSLEAADDQQQQQQQQQQLQAEQQQQQQQQQQTALHSEAVPPLLSEISGMSETDYEAMRRLQARVQQLEAILPRLQLKDAVDGADPELVEKLDRVLGQSGELNTILGLIKGHFDACYGRLRHYETKMQKELERKLDIEKKHQELVKLLAYKEVKISELERRVEILEHASYDGVLVWKIADVERRKAEAREGKVCSIYSPPFYTGKAGYKMCGRLYLNGDGAGKNTHISLFFVIMRGQFDALLPWPFSKKVSMMLMDQNFEEHVIDAFKPDTNSSSFKRPTTEMNIASGCPLFMPITDFESSGKGYVKNDTMFIKFIVDKSDLPT